jgi:HlyD family secretion protein
VPNDDLRLKPGMTANLKVQINRRPDAVRVPNTALRFRPTVDMFAALNQPVPPDAIGGGRGRGGRGAGGANGARASGAMGANGANAASDPNGATRATPGATGAMGANGARGAKGAAGAAGAADKGSKPPAANTAAPKNALSDVFVPKYGSAQSAQSIDALFAPLQPVESRGRVWLYIDKQLKPINLRLGITDGTNTELLSGDLQQGTEVVTTVSGMSATTRTPANAGNPLLPQRGGRGR